MNAVISGRAAVALMIDGEQIYSVHYDAPEQRVERAPEEWNLLFGGVGDLEFVEDCDEASVRDRLEDAVDSTEALDLVLYLFDGSLSDDVRRTASLELDELLVYPEITAYLEAILYARPLGQSADPVGARRCCDAKATNTSRLIDELIGQQKAVSVVRTALESACQDIADEEEAKDVESACLRAGLFARFARAGSDSNAVNGVLLSGLQDRTLLERLAADLVRTTLTAWARNIRELWSQDHPQRQEKQESLTSADSSERDGAVPRGKEKRRKSYDRGQAKFNVDSQKEHVVDLLRRGKLAQARRVIDQVVDYNIDHGGTEYACKTLCSLAKAAQDLGLSSLQLELTERSIALDRDDGWSWTQHGQALLDAGRLDDALRAYDRALQLTSDVEAENGRAEVLKAQGQLDEALSAYEQVIREHPENVVAKNGRACVLVEMGRWDDALAGLPTLSDRHHQNWVGLHIRGMILLKTDQLSAARQIFEVGLAKCPFAIQADYFRAGLCLVDIAERRYAAAAKALAQVREPALKRPATLLRVHALGADEQYSDAAKIYKIALDPASQLEREIKAELAVRYVDRSGSQHDDGWLLEREVRLLLAA